MKLMIASDIHGSFYFCKKLVELYKQEKAERLILLGDILYHGPRNDLPRDYAPKEVITLLNGMKNDLLCVRGNCDTEVDQMVLDFPIMADYMTMFLDGHMVFATHGHKYSMDDLPPLKKGDILLHGHTHVQAMRDMSDYIYLNPGSVSIPKEGNRHSCMIYESGVYSIIDLEGTVIDQMVIR